MSKKRAKKPVPPVDPYADYKREVKFMPTSEIVKRVTSIIVRGLHSPTEDQILSDELDARIPAEHKYQERWPSDYEGEHG